MINLVGEARPMTRAGFEEALSIVGCNEAQLRTIIEVEALSCGFLQSKLLVILYERHIFYKQTNGKYSIGYEDISSKQSTPAGKYGSNEYQYTKLFKAATLNEHAALKSCSWGIGQILGENYKLAGYATVEQMISEFIESEDSQVIAIAHFISNVNIRSAVIKNDFDKIALRYNGANYKKFGYDDKLRWAYKKNVNSYWDIETRALQVKLFFAGFYTGKIDGVNGPKTREAAANAAKKNALI